MEDNRTNNILNPGNNVANGIHEDVPESDSPPEGEAGYSSLQEELVQTPESVVSQQSDDDSDPEVLNYQPNKDHLDVLSKIYWLRKQPLPPTPNIDLLKEKRPFSTAIDPSAVGVITMQEVLQDAAILDEELRKNEQSMEWYKNPYDTRCSCDVRRHPNSWTRRLINDVHQHSFLLECKHLVIEKELLYAATNTDTLVVINVPMLKGHPWLDKAQQVMRYTDVEVGIGDQAVNNVLHYKQPLDRKILLALASHKAIGLVVAEKISFANRIRTDSNDFRDLEVQPVPVKVGINRLWVHVSMRRRRIGTLLCEFAGRAFNDRRKMKEEDFAFNSSSTDDGIAFANHFVNTSRIPMYRGKPGIKTVNLGNNI